MNQGFISKRVGNIHVRSSVQATANTGTHAGHRDAWNTQSGTHLFDVRLRVQAEGLGFVIIRNGQGASIDVKRVREAACTHVLSTVVANMYSAVRTYIAS